MNATSYLSEATETILQDGPIGLLSDAHGDQQMAVRAVAMLVERGAMSLLYLGDVCGDGVIDALAGVVGVDGSMIQARMVFGNMDFDVAPMTNYAESIGVGVDHPCGVYRCGQSVLVTTHGHLQGFEEAAIERRVGYFLHGHTHLVRDDRIGSTRICNPGALHRAQRLTAAVLDCKADSFEVFEVT